MRKLGQLRTKNGVLGFLNLILNRKQNTSVLFRNQYTSIRYDSDQFFKCCGNETSSCTWNEVAIQLSTVILATYFALWWCLYRHNINQYWKKHPYYMHIGWTRRHEPSTQSNAPLLPFIFFCYLSTLYSFTNFNIVLFPFFYCTSFSRSYTDP